MDKMVVLPVCFYRFLKTFRQHLIVYYVCLVRMSGCFSFHSCLPQQTSFPPSPLLSSTFPSPPPPLFAACLLATSVTAGWLGDQQLYLGYYYHYWYQLPVLPPQQIQLLPSPAQLVRLPEGDQGARCRRLHAPLFPEGPPGPSRRSQEGQGEQLL